jgi:hypothetical protein
MYNVKTAIACLVLSAGCLVGGAGCHGDDTPVATDRFDTTMPDTAGMSKDDLLAQGNAMIQRGQSIKDDAAGLKPGETIERLTPDELMMKGDELMKHGKTMVDMAATR